METWWLWEQWREAPVKREVARETEQFVWAVDTWPPGTSKVNRQAKRAGFHRWFRTFGELADYMTEHDARKVRYAELQLQSELEKQAKNAAWIEAQAQEGE